MKQAIYLMSAACLLLHACTKDNESTFSHLTFTFEGGQQEIAVSATTEWEARYEANWFTAEISGNRRNGTILVDVHLNYQAAERSAKIFVTTLSGSIIGEITISQEGDTPLQVYDYDRTPFNGDMDLVGIPNIPYALFDRPHTFPGSSFRENHPLWEVSGEVKDGIMAFDFSNEKRELTSAYKKSNGLTYSILHIQQKNNQNRVIELIKRDDFSFLVGFVRILYVDGDFSNEWITFKSGWNFVEYYHNPDWFIGSSEPSWFTGMVTQNVDDLLEKGYRWYLAHWAIGPPWPQ